MSTILDYYKKKAEIIDRIKNEYLYNVYYLPEEGKKELIKDLTELDKEFNNNITPAKEEEYIVIADSISQYLEGQEDDSYS